MPPLPDLSLPDLGPPVADWVAPSAPKGEILSGQYCRLVPLQAEDHAALLFNIYQGHSALWHYMPYGPFSSAAQYHRWVRQTVENKAHLFYAIYDLDMNMFGGVASYLRINPEAGSIEIGHINFAPQLQRSRAATEAIYLMMRWAFSAGYRRLEWKCNACNIASRRAAQRLGLSFEGIFRQTSVVKGRNRDTAWFAAIDSEWSALDQAFSVWLAPRNFAPDRTQKERLSDLTRLVRVSGDPALQR